MTTENCATCKFSTLTTLVSTDIDTPEDEREFSHLACRRYPPTMSPTNEGGDGLANDVFISIPVMTLVHADEWCGEFKEIPSEPFETTYTTLRRQCGDTNPHPEHVWTWREDDADDYTRVLCPGVEVGR